MITQYALRNKILTPSLLIILFTCCALTTSVHAQIVHIPDLNLRLAVNEHLNLPPNTQLTRSDVASIVRFNAGDRNIKQIVGLEHMTNLRRLDLGGNDITNLTPIAGLTTLERLSMPVNPLSNISAIANLTRLTRLDLGNCQIIDITPLQNLTTLVELQLNGNLIQDLRPLAGLSQLATLHLHRNDISDISPLAHLTQLNTLTVHANNIVDHSAISGLSLTKFIYDPICDIPADPIRPRLENRNFPSVFAAWSHILNQPYLSAIDQFTKHDLYWSEMFGLRFLTNDNKTIITGQLDVATKERDENLARNPNMLFLVEIRMRDAKPKHFGDDWPYWARDDQGNTFGDPWRVIDFTHPHVQDMIVQQALAVSKCGLYDGIFLDWWNEDRSVLKNRDSYEAEQRARDNILQRIRAATRPEFLIMVNTNTRIIPRTGKYINGGFMETGVPHGEVGEALEGNLIRVEQSLFWLEQNLREPRINGFEGWGIPTQPPDSPDNLRWMRAITSLTLTHSDGYVLFNVGDGGHNHYWYDFWDADLGQPVEEKGQLYQETEGLYIREFTNGWAVYNHSGVPQAVTLPEEVQGVASGWVGTEHALPNLDGEMYLRVPAVNPADVNGDGVVNIFDLTLVAQAIGTGDGQGDVNEDGVVNVFDLVFVAGAIGGGAAPSAHSLDPSNISAADVERWLEQAQGLGVGDANFQRGIRFLEGLLAALTPEETTLLPNYPNPFNPETWIPYRLAREAEVSITIYDTKGTLVRRLALGNQEAGYYAERGKAAYWDGRNEDGEAVASGIYVYQFRAGDYAATRRMVIVK